VGPQPTGLAYDNQRKVLYSFVESESNIVRIDVSVPSFPKVSSIGVPMKLMPPEMLHGKNRMGIGQIKVVDDNKRLAVWSPVNGEITISPLDAGVGVPTERFGIDERSGRSGDSAPSDGLDIGTSILTEISDSGRIIASVNLESSRLRVWVRATQ
jgi:hypothetical protein